MKGEFPVRAGRMTGSSISVMVGGAAVAAWLMVVDAARPSPLSQSVGYALAAVRPFLFRLLHDAGDGWTVPVSLSCLPSSCVAP